MIASGHLLGAIFLIRVIRFPSSPICVVTNGSPSMELPFCKRDGVLLFETAYLAAVQYSTSTNETQWAVERC
jgi:hypothetical protein